ncbi:MAG: hypothetical protein ABI794_13985 [Betaproteobacteria bacterium]
MGIINEFSPHPVWVETLDEFVRPYWNEILEGDFVEGIAHRRLTVPEMQG